MDTTFYIVRHGETEANVRKILQGHKDYALTEKGIQQAKEVAVKLKHTHFDKIFSSDLLRAKKTAGLLLLEHKIAIETTKRLRERSFGKYEGKPYEYTDPDLDKLMKKYNILSRKEQFRFNRYRKETESDEELSSRMLTFLRELAVTYRGKTILIVSHGGIMGATLRKLFGFDEGKINHVSVKNLAYFRLRSDGIDFFVEETSGIEIG
ncbi:hypothetical protein A2866_01770 [Candidatus Roizmanbacteria bacterium RIFCSPHIGHO2_01_FULL_39_8]|uniref:Phosphoglycerate mutase (2,3-diphosphoglycerate-dependent) n=1 Tax=Candidatus Roizmanbacteria bacterium RIFCSPHIGHO2_01_FULL_39_8 TaxID=1802033 RepID=A0A1F7GKJ4_9BACT|nr:MAG: hypothetical protein A2866_01770 [Candidatus Roizmanbacteria bacterium RIFCSPHIGHO2_01_FULL_39_8]